MHEGKGKIAQGGNSSNSTYTKVNHSATNTITTSQTIPPPVANKLASKPIINPWSKPPSIPISTPLASNNETLEDMWGFQTYAGQSTGGMSEPPKPKMKYAEVAKFSTTDDSQFTDYPDTDNIYYGEQLDYDEEYDDDLMNQHELDMYMLACEPEQATATGSEANMSSPVCAFYLSGNCRYY